MHRKIRGIELERDGAQPQKINWSGRQRRKGGRDGVQAAVMRLPSWWWCAFVSPGLLLILDTFSHAFSKPSFYPVGDSFPRDHSHQV
jgi:hypothetical protein